MALCERIQDGRIHRREGRLWFGEMILCGMTLLKVVYVYMRFLIRVSGSLMDSTTFRIESRSLRCLKMIFSRRGAEWKIAYVWVSSVLKAERSGLLGE